MKRSEFLAWGARFHYPFLAISRKQPLRHGKDAYELASRSQIDLAAVRIARWNEIVTASQLEQTIGIVDNMLTSVRGVQAPQESEMGI